MSPRKNTEEEEERFEAWVTVMDDVLEEFKELLPTAVACSPPAPIDVPATTS